MCGTGMTVDDWVIAKPSHFCEMQLWTHRGLLFAFLLTLSFVVTRYLSLTRSVTLTVIPTVILYACFTGTGAMFIIVSIVESFLKSFHYESRPKYILHSVSFTMIFLSSQFLAFAMAARQLIFMEIVIAAKEVRQKVDMSRYRRLAYGLTGSMSVVLVPLWVVPWSTTNRDRFARAGCIVFAVQLNVLGFVVAYYSREMLKLLEESLPRLREQLARRRRSSALPPEASQQPSGQQQPVNQSSPTSISKHKHKVSIDKKAEVEMSSSEEAPLQMSVVKPTVTVTVPSPSTEEVKETVTAAKTNNSKKRGSTTGASTRRASTNNRRPSTSVGGRGSIGGRGSVAQPDSSPNQDIVKLEYRMQTIRDNIKTTLFTTTLGALCYVAMGAFQMHWWLMHLSQFFGVSGQFGVLRFLRSLDSYNSRVAKVGAGATSPTNSKRHSEKPGASKMNERRRSASQQGRSSTDAAHTRTTSIPPAQAAAKAAPHAKFLELPHNEDEAAVIHPPAVAEEVGINLMIPLSSHDHYAHGHNILPHGHSHSHSHGHPHSPHRHSQHRPHAENLSLTIQPPSDDVRDYTHITTQNQSKDEQAKGEEREGNNEVGSISLVLSTAGGNDSAEMSIALASVPLTILRSSSSDDGRSATADRV